MITDAIILAAGASTRLGRPKQLLPFRGQTLLGRAIVAVSAAPVRRVLVVLGAHAALIRAHANADGVDFVENVDWRHGMGSSIGAGMRALPAQPPPDAVLLAVCDQPLLTSEHVAALVEAHRQHPGSLVASRYDDDVVGVPALFPRALFAELRAMAPHSGAKAIIQRHRDMTVLLPFPEGAFDIDTPDDYEQLSPGGSSQNRTENLTRMRAPSTEN
ncbi:MAG: 4-diphosphocytidyl-2C-methyl-D-erythritolsynthas e [Myxococcales bacterium]|nr:4-diphosphocytidyl-2C-methyl-D-erythritolsynthas e [Myxococcales bacterium]